MLSSSQFRPMPGHTIVVLGDGGVGKTCICAQFAHEHFIETYDPTGSDDYRKQITVDGIHCMLTVLDTAGQEEWTTLREHYIQHGEAFLLVFSITSKASFTRVKRYYQKVREIKKTSVPLILVGNKCDLACKYREVSSQEAEGLAQEIGCTFVETSAKIPINIDEAFHNLVRLQRRINEEQRVAEAIITAAPAEGSEAEKKSWKKRLSVFLKSAKKKAG